MNPIPEREHPTCDPQPFSSRACHFGTRACEAKHDPVDVLEMMLAKATPGQWAPVGNGTAADGEETYYVTAMMEGGSVAINYVASIGGGSGAAMRPADACLVSYARNALPGLIRDVRRLRACLDKLSIDRDLACPSCGDVFGDHDAGCELAAAMGWLDPTSARKDSDDGT